MPPPAILIETARLRLRPHRRDDHAALTALWTDPEVVRFIGGRPHGGQEIWGRLLRYAGHWALFGYGMVALERRVDGAFVGEAGYSYLERGLGPDYDAWPELGYVLSSAAQGSGLAREAMTALADWADRTLNAAETVCIIAPENARSLRLAAALGYVVFDRRPNHGADVLLLRRQRGG